MELVFCDTDHMGSDARHRGSNEAGFQNDLGRALGSPNFAVEVGPRTSRWYRRRGFLLAPGDQPVTIGAIKPGMQMQTPLSRELTPEEAWQITCHEAGHAVGAVRLQIPFSHIERGDGEHGEVAVGVGPIENPNRNRTQDEISRWQQFYAAGAAGEQVLFGCYREYASRRDRYLHEVLEKRWCPNRSGGWDQDIQFAMKVLDRESIEKVAQKLDQHKKLTDEQVCELLGCAPPWV
jgi:hypothetical protein